MELPDNQHCLSFPALPAVHVWLEVNGQSLPLHQTPDMRDRAEAFVEVAEGQEYTIWVSDQRKQPPTDAPWWSVELFIDGYRRNNVATSTSDVLYGTDEADLERFWPREGIYEETGKVSRFRFAAVNTAVEGDAAVATDDRLQQMGCIEARYLRIRAMLPFTDNLLDPTVLPVIGAGAELKAGVELRTGFSEAVDTAVGNFDFVEPDFLDPEDSPFSSLRFYYRPRGYLQARGFIPYDSPSSNFEDDSDDCIVAGFPAGLQNRAPSVSPTPSTFRSASPSPTASTTARQQQRLKELQERERVKREELEDIQRERDALLADTGSEVRAKRKVKKEEDAEAGRAKWKGKWKRRRVDPGDEVLVLE